MRALLLCACLLVGCAGPRPGGASPDDVRSTAALPGGVARTLGDWVGTRRDVDDGSVEPLVMRVRAVLGGAGVTRELVIEHSRGVYRGFSVDVWVPERGVWVRRYVNDVRRTFAELEGDGHVFRATSPTRSREGRVTSEFDGETWIRRMEVSEDGGDTWRGLFVDELRRAPR